MKEKPIDGLNMIPFIDIMLVLLVIVLTTSSFIATGKIPINLPQASESATPSDTVKTIDINAQGEIFYQDKPVNIGQLKQAITSWDKKTPFLLRADAATKLQAFISVAELLKQSGFTQVAVQTKK